MLRISDLSWERRERCQGHHICQGKEESDAQDIAFVKVKTTQEIKTWRRILMSSHSIVKRESGRREAGFSGCTVYCLYNMYCARWMTRGMPRSTGWTGCQHSSISAGSFPVSTEVLGPIDSISGLLFLMYSRILVHIQKSFQISNLPSCSWMFSVM